MDTVCIDKSSSAELAEAYLEDVELEAHHENKFYLARWFLRGWTLQELLAPETVEFYNKFWKEFGTKGAFKVTSRAVLEFALK